MCEWKSATGFREGRIMSDPGDDQLFGCTDCGWQWARGFAVLVMLGALAFALWCLAWAVGIGRVTT